MQQRGHSILRGALVGCALLLFIRAQAQQSNDSNVPAATARQQAAEIARGDPARWHTIDATEAQRLHSLRKEIGAALQEAQGACRALPAPERSACVKQARAIYLQDTANAKASPAGAPAR